MTPTRRLGTGLSVSMRTVHRVGGKPFVAVAASVALHALLFMLVGDGLSSANQPERPAAEPRVVILQTLLPARNVVAPEPRRATRTPVAPAAQPQSVGVPEFRAAVDPATPREPASLAAPPAPTAQEWAFAASYTLKNSKGYRYTWGQQVRSMMGTAVEGPDQGVVRFRVEIAPDGSLARLDTLWSTSAVAERLARQAIDAMPRWPPTPTGQPLIFERTISFTPFASDGPPIYQDDCLPDPPAFGNPFAWDGSSARQPVERKPAERPDPQAMADCLKQLPQDSIDAESARDRRVMDRWGSSKSGP